MQLLLQGLAAHGQRLHFKALLLELPAQQLRLLLGLGPAFFGFAQLTVGVFQSVFRGTHFVIDDHAFFQQLFELQTQLFQRCGALLQPEVQLLAFLGEAFGLHLQTLQCLTCRIVLCPQRTQTHRQLVAVVLVLARFLAHPVQSFTQAVTLSQQQFALFGVQRHAVQSVLQLQA